MQNGPLSTEKSGHEHSKWFGHGENEDKEEGDLEYAVECHGFNVKGQ